MWFINKVDYMKKRNPNLIPSNSLRYANDPWQIEPTYLVFAICLKFWSTKLKVDCLSDTTYSQASSIKFKSPRKICLRRQYMSHTITTNNILPCGSKVRDIRSEENARKKHTHFSQVTIYAILYNILKSTYRHSYSTKYIASNR